MNKIAKFFRDFGLTSFLALVGITLVIFSIFAFRGVDHIKNFIKTEATVSDVVLYEDAHYDIDDNYIEATYKVFVKYNVDEVEYESEYGVFSGYKVGDKLTICYNPDDPYEIAQPNGIALPIIILVVGIASSVGAVITCVFAIKKRKKLIEQEKEWENGKQNV
ncbi:MAG: hypothetical protein J5689_00850 [Clostridia bacterium]|nr:hypothetical protein [Clostridia bacterium]